MRETGREVRETEGNEEGGRASDGGRKRGREKGDI